MGYHAVDLSKKKADALVIHCVDPRFQAAYRQVIDELGLYFDLLAVPGASKAVVENPSIIDYVKLLHDFHHFEKVHIFDHIECGAFGKVEDEVKDHSTYLKTAVQKITENLSEVKVQAHLLGADQELTVEL